MNSWQFNDEFVVFAKRIAKENTIVLDIDSYEIPEKKDECIWHNVVYKDHVFVMILTYDIIFFKSGEEDSQSLWHLTLAPETPDGTLHEEVIAEVPKMILGENVKEIPPKFIKTTANIKQFLVTI